jgi:hypothetical protein
MHRDAANVRLKQSNLEVHRLKLQVADNVALRQERDAANVRLKESNVEAQLLKKERDAARSRLGKMADYGQRMDVFAAAEERLAFLSLDNYQADVFLRLAESVAAGCLDRTMDVHHAASGWRIHRGVEVTQSSTNKQHSLFMLVSLAHNAPPSPSDTGRRFGDQLMRFWTVVFGQCSAAGAHRALTAGHCDACDGGSPPVNMKHCPSPSCLEKFGRKLDGSDDVTKGGVYRDNIKRGVRDFVVRQLEIEKMLSRKDALCQMQCFSDEGKLLERLGEVQTCERSTTTSRVENHFSLCVQRHGFKPSGAAVVLTSV